MPIEPALHTVHLVISPTPQSISSDSPHSLAELWSTHKSAACALCNLFLWTSHVIGVATCYQTLLIPVNLFANYFFSIHTFKVRMEVSALVAFLLLVKYGSESEEPAPSCSEEWKRLQTPTRAEETRAQSQVSKIDDGSCRFGGKSDACADSVYTRVRFSPSPKLRKKTSARAPFDFLCWKWNKSGSDSSQKSLYTIIICKYVLSSH